MSSRIDVQAYCMPRQQPLSLVDPGYSGGFGVSIENTICALAVYKTTTACLSDPWAFKPSPSDIHIADITPPERRASMNSVSSTSKSALEHIEENTPHPEQFLPLFPVLQGKTPQELEMLDRAVLRKLDWWFLPCVTMMLLMR